MRGEGSWGPLVCIGIQFVQVVIFAIPGEITQIAAGYVFGAWKGFLYAVVGIMLGSACNYSFARLVGRPVMEKVLGQRRLERIDKLFRIEQGEIRSVRPVPATRSAQGRDVLCRGADSTEGG